MIDGRWIKDLFFDQFATERVMLSKWAQYEGLVQSVDEADVVVIPSLVLQHMAIGGFLWSSIAGDKVEESRADLEKHELFWQQIQRRHFDPEKSNNPLIVQHVPFTMDLAGVSRTLKALSKQPAQFVDHVVFLNIESDIPLKSDPFPSLCSPNLEVEVARRLKWKGVHDHGRGCPLRITVPYATPLQTAVRFRESSDSYEPPDRRLFAVEMETSDEKLDMRLDLRKQFNMHRGNPRSQVLLGENTSQACHQCNNFNMWEKLVQSEFCIEPPGDTLTRSHFYLAVQSGCIPVIFDKGNKNFDTTLPTSWPYRSLEKSPLHAELPMLDYHDFAVVYDWPTTLERKVDVIKELVDMPTNDPHRFESLRKNLDDVAPMFTYSAQKCNGQNCQDAFSAVVQTLHTVVSHNLASI